MLARYLHRRSLLLVSLLANLCVLRLTHYEQSATFLKRCLITCLLIFLERSQSYATRLKHFLYFQKHHIKTLAPYRVTYFYFLMTHCKNYYKTHAVCFIKQVTYNKLAPSSRLLFLCSVPMP